MDLLVAIDRALDEVARYQGTSWHESVKNQLVYCAEVVRDHEKPGRLEKLNMGYIVLRELDGCEPNALMDALPEIQLAMQLRYLDYAAKVRLGIHKMRKTDDT
jgi:hypothetical protein